jgi:hypothetical protein
MLQVTVVGLFPEHLDQTLVVTSNKKRLATRALVGSYLPHPDRGQIITAQKGKMNPTFLVYANPPRLAIPAYVPACCVINEADPYLKRLETISHDSTTVDDDDLFLFVLLACPFPAREQQTAQNSMHVPICRIQAAALRTPAFLLLECVLMVRR